jgi:hypothetical protein
MSEQFSTIEWKEMPSVRRQAYQGAYARHLLGELLVWVVWWMIIAGICTWRMGNPPWSYRGASTIAFLGFCGLLIRAIMEQKPRDLWLNQETFRIHHIKFYSCPLNEISDVSFTPIGGDFFRMRFQAQSKRGRRRQFVIGLDRRTVTRAMALFGAIDPAKGDLPETSWLTPRHQPEVLKPLYQLYIRGLAWLCIAGGMAAGVRGLTARHLNMAVANGVIAIVSLLVGTSIVRQGFLLQWYRQLWARGRRRRR